VRIVHTCTIVWLLVWPALPAEAQRPAAARLVLTVIDPSGARIPNATATILARNDVTLPTPRTYLGPAGHIVADDLAPGMYNLRVDAAGFASVHLDGLRVSGEVRQTVRLTLYQVSETVVVESDQQSTAIDPRGFSTVLTRDQIDALPDDPAEMAALLRDLAPPGAVIRIDGFPGGLVPPKSQILSIRLPRLDSYAAQEHGGLTALSFIEIVTTPGGGRLQGASDVSWRHGGLSARHPLTHSPPADSARAAALSLDGPLIRDTSSFALSVRGGTLASTAAVGAVGPDGHPIADDPVRAHAWTALSGRLVSSAWGGQTARVSVSREQRTAHNAGVGGLNLRDRAYRLSTFDWNVRAVSSGPLGRRLSMESRLDLGWRGQRATPFVEAPTVKVLDAFHAGGAQVAGAERSFDLAGGVDLEYGRGVHALRAGVLVEREHSRSARHLNYLGTYTFSSLDAYLAGRPTTYTRRVGRPASELTNLQFAAYTQDDVRMRRSVLIGYGVRYERQSTVGGAGRLLPRVSLAWSPSRRGTTTVRAGAGLFSEWLAPEVYHQSRLLDGTQQFDILIHQPGYPEPDENSGVVRRERYGLSPDVRLPLVTAASIGVEQQLGALARVHAGYSRRAARHLLRGRDAHQRADGQPPEEASGNVVLATSDAGLHTHTVVVQASSLGVGRRASVIAAYVFSATSSNTAGAFVAPPTGVLDEEWGPTMPAHTFTATMSARAIGPISLSLTPRWRSGIPYSVTTALDTNRDGLFTERPRGTRRHSQRTPPQFDLGARIAVAVGFGRGSHTGGTPAVDSVGSASPRYRIEVFVAAQNVTNRPTYTAMGSVLGSPLFGRPLAALDPRRIDMGVRLIF
jgi:hypothetical protein